MEPSKTVMEQAGVATFCVELDDLQAEESLGCPVTVIITLNDGNHASMSVETGVRLLHVILMLTEITIIAFAWHYFMNMLPSVLRRPLYTHYEFMQMLVMII